MSPIRRFSSEPFAVWFSRRIAKACWSRHPRRSRDWRAYRWKFLTKEVPSRSFPYRSPPRRRHCLPPPRCRAKQVTRLWRATRMAALNSAANPAPEGSVVVLYGTGQGASGLPVSVQIGGRPSEVLYAGAVAGYPGLLQINVRIPPQGSGPVLPGNVSVSISVGQASSQPGLGIAVE